MGGKEIGHKNVPAVQIVYIILSFAPKKSISSLFLDSVGPVVTNDWCISVLLYPMLVSSNSVSKPVLNSLNLFTRQYRNQ